MSGKTGKAEKAQKSSWFKGMKAEFKKIVWPDKNTLAKQTAAVVIVYCIDGRIDLCDRCTDEIWD